MDIERQQVQIDALGNFLNSIQSYHNYLIQFVEPDQRFYHYTDLNALNNIVSNHDIWLTNSRYSNDRDEVLHGYRVAKEVVEKRLRSEKRKRPKDETRMEYIEAVSALIEEPAPEGFYVCCFCEEDNLLSQWRSYGANGTGVSLGFDPQSFEAIAGPDMPSGLMRLWRVFYKPKTQKKIVHAALEFYAAQLNQGYGVEDTARLAADAIQFFIPTFKNEDFAEEKERRLIFTPRVGCPVKPRYRVARGMLVPYYSLAELARESSGQQWPLPIKSVLVGPSSQIELNEESTKMLLMQHGYDQVEVIASDTPYRG